MKNVMIAAGGTGGHIYPALALAEILQKQEPNCRVTFFGSSNRMEAQIIPQAGYPFYSTEMTGTNGGLSQKIKSLQSLLKANSYCRKLLKEEKPDICIGFGNYISVPLIKEAHALHIPVILHEANSYAGKANCYLAKYADGIVTCYDDCAKQLPAAKIRKFGNPEASLAVTVRNRDEILRGYDLDPAKPVVFFMMGSLGSDSVAKVIDEACSLFDPAFQVLITTGKANAYTYTSKVNIQPYVDGKAMLYACDLAVVRAGATTMAEVGALGTPAVFIPSPYVPNNHQYYNAMEFVRAGAGMILEEKDLTPGRLADMVNSLMKAPEKREEMHKMALRLGTPNAAQDMIAWMEDIVNHG